MPSGYSETKRALVRRKLLDLSRPIFNCLDYHSDFIKNHNLEIIKCCYYTNYTHFAIVRNLNTNLQGVFSYSKTEIKSIIPLDFDYISIVGKLIKVKQNGLYGLYSLSGVLIIPINFDAISIEGDLVIVKQNDLYGLYSSSGVLIMPINFDTISIKGDLVIVKQNGLYGLYSPSGVLIMPINFDAISIEGDLVIVKQNGLYGVYSSSGVLIIPINFDAISVERNLIKIRKELLKGVYSASLSKFIVPLENHSIEILSDCIVTTSDDIRKIKKLYYDFSGNIIKSEIESKPIKFDKSDFLEGFFMGWW